MLTVIKMLFYGLKTNKVYSGTQFIIFTVKFRYATKASRGQQQKNAYYKEICLVK